MHTREIEYDADGRRMIGHWAVDQQATERRPAVLLAHEGPGLDDHVRGRADRLAALGYAAFALDYHGGGERLAPKAFMERLGALAQDADRMRAIATAGLDVLLGQPESDPERVAVVGYCFGGVMAVELARTGAPLKAVVGFHPGFTSPRPDDSRHITGSVLMCCAADDPIITRKDRSGFEDEMRSAGVADWRIMLLGGAGHSFTNPRADEVGLPGIGFDALADRRSWAAMLELFDEVLTTTPPTPPGDSL